jgi:cupin fold WbuC family metalloprotein
MFNIENLATETSPGVFHCKDWGIQIPSNIVVGLVEIASNISTNKARLCLHPSPDSQLQITYLAFVAPYADRIHSHPNREEVIFPLFGTATHTSYDADGQAFVKTKLDSTNPVALSTKTGVLHSLVVSGPAFVMLEIGTGPFVINESTHYLS